MSRKQTLKSILGSSDERVQVEYEGITEAVTPTVVPSGGTVPVVQQMPKTNKLMQVVDAMNKVPKLYATGIGIAQAQAAEDLAKLSDTEIAKELAQGDEGALSIFGYNKAYNEGLVKRHYKVNASTYANDFAALSTNLTDYPTEAEFNAALEEKVETIKRENAELFGGNRFQLEYNNQAFNEVMGEYVAKASGEYLANKQEATVLQYSTDFLDDVKGGLDIQTSLKNFQADLNELPIDNPNKAKLLLDNVEAAYNTFANNGEFKKAEALLNEAENYEIVKGGRLGAGKNSTTFSRLRDDLDLKSATKDEASVSRQFQRVTGQYDRVANNLMFGTVENEDIEDLITTLRPDLDDKTINTLISGVTEPEDRLSKVIALNSLVRDLGEKEYTGDNQTFRPSDVAQEVSDRMGSVTSAFELSVRTKPPESWTGLTEQQSADLITTAQAGYFEQNPTSSVRQFMYNQGLGGVKPPQEVIDAFNKAHELDYVKRMNEVKNLKSTLDTVSMGVLKNLRVYMDADSDTKSALRSTISSEVMLEVDNIRESILNYASTLSGTPEENKEAIGDFIRDEVNRFVEIRGMVANAAGIYSGFNRDKRFISREDYNPDDKDKTTLEDKVAYKLEGMNESYPHITNASRNINVRLSGSGSRTFLADGGSLSDIYSDMRGRKDKRAIEVTQRLYGYDTFDPKAADDLKLTGLTTAEVKLFGDIDEFNSKYESYRSVLTKYLIESDSLTDDELVVFEELTNFGIFNEDSFNYFFTTQRTNLEQF